MTAKQYLQQIRTLKRNIERQMDSIDETFVTMQMISSPSLEERVQTSPRDRMPELAAKLDSEEAKLKIEIERETDLIIRISQQIAGLRASDNEKDVLHLRYIMCKPWAEIIDMMGYTDRRVYQLHGTALQAFGRQYLKDFSEFQ